MSVFVCPSRARAHTHTLQVVTLRLRASELCRLEGGMASSRSFFISLSAPYLLLYFCCGVTISGNKRGNQDRCAFKVKHNSTLFLFVLFRQHLTQFNCCVGAGLLAPASYLKWALTHLTPAFPFL